MSKNFIKFYMRDKRLDISLSMEQAERIIDNPQQLVKVVDEYGKWTGVTINKAEIRGTDHDFEMEKYHSQEEHLMLDRGEMSEEEIKKADEAREKVIGFMKEKGLKKI